MSVPQNAEGGNKTIPSKCLVNVEKFKHLGMTATRKFKNPLSSSLLLSDTNIELREIFVVIDL